MLTCGQNSLGSTRPVSRLLPLIRYAYPILLCPLVFILVHSDVICSLESNLKRLECERIIFIEEPTNESQL
nr:unnamed protein product [Fasciola hepatica]